MAMTAKTDASAITPTAAAKASSVKAGAELTALHAHLQIKLGETATLVRQIISLTPAGDANLSALNALLAELL